MRAGAQAADRAGAELNAAWAVHEQQEVEEVTKEEEEKERDTSTFARTR